MSVEKLYQSGGYVVQCDECRRQSEALRSSAEDAAASAEQLEWWICPVDRSYALCPACQDQIVSLAEGISVDRDDDEPYRTADRRDG